MFVFVTALYQPGEYTRLFGRALFISAGTVTLCSLWPTLINTAFGAASVQQDFLNVGKVLRLNWRQRIWRIVMPSSLPYLFTGLRLSLGVGWMVLIAADMVYHLNDDHYFQWIVLNVPFRRMKDLVDDEVQAKVPQGYRGLATALKLRVVHSTSAFRLNVTRRLSPRSCSCAVSASPHSSHSRTLENCR